MKLKQDNALPESVTTTVNGQRLLVLLGLFLLIVTTFSLYWPAITSGLVSDDWGLSMPDTDPWLSFLGHWWGGGEGQFYRPLSRILLYYEARIFGYSGLGQHIVSTLMFLATISITGLLVYKCAGINGAFVTALLLITSPVAATVVSWISSQTDLLVMLFIALSIFPLGKDPINFNRSNVIISLTFGLLAYLSKESAAILGPLAVVLVIYLFLLKGPRNLFKYKYALMAAGLHTALLLLYLAFRAWRLGRVGAGEIDPVHGWVWHSSQLYVSALRDFFIPISSLFPVTVSTEVQAFGSVWTLVLTLCIILFLLYKRLTVLSFVFAGFIVALIPHLSAPATLAYPEIGMSDIRRYLYVPLFFLWAGVGIAYGKSKSGAGSLLVIAGFALFQGSLAQVRVVEYAKAGEFRDRLMEATKQAVTNTNSNKEKPAFYIGRLPDKIGEAYSFRNGISELLSVMYPGSRTYLSSSASISDLPSGNLYLIDTKPGFAVEVKDMSQIIKTQKEVATDTPPRFVLDFENQIHDFSELRKNEVIEFEQKTPFPIIKVNGPDPNLFIPPPEAQPYYKHQSAFVTLDFLDAPEKGEEALMQYYWVLGSEGPDVDVPHVDTMVPVQKGKQTVTFELSKHPLWFREGKIRWHRIDLPESYRGRVAIYAIGLK